MRVRHAQHYVVTNGIIQAATEQWVCAIQSIANGHIHTKTYILRLK